MNRMNSNNTNQMPERNIYLGIIIVLLLLLTGLGIWFGVNNKNLKNDLGSANKEAADRTKDLGNCQEDLAKALKTIDSLSEKLADCQDSLANQKVNVYLGKELTLKDGRDGRFAYGNIVAKNAKGSSRRFIENKVDSIIVNDTCALADTCQNNLCLDGMDCDSIGCLDAFLADSITITQETYYRKDTVVIDSTYPKYNMMLNELNQYEAQRREVNLFLPSLDQKTKNQFLWALGHAGAAFISYEVANHYEQRAKKLVFKGFHNVDSWKALGEEYGFEPDIESLEAYNNNMQALKDEKVHLEGTAETWRWIGRANVACFVVRTSIGTYRIITSPNGVGVGINF